MIIRTKSGEHRAGDVSALLNFLGVQKGTAGAQKVSCDVELIASVPFRLAADVEAGQGYPWTLSTYDLDRYAERIDPSGWDIRAYLENPVVEWSHNYLIPAIGKIEGLHANDHGLHGLVYFNDKAYDVFGWGIGQRVKAGVIRAGSVGFRPIEIEIPGKEDGKDGTTLIFRKQELLEFSICNVPANPFALTRNGREQVTGNKEQGEGNSAAHYWAGLINNFDGV